MFTSARAALALVFVYSRAHADGFPALGMGLLRRGLASSLSTSDESDSDDDDDDDDEELLSTFLCFFLSFLILHVHARLLLEQSSLSYHSAYLYLIVFLSF